MRLLELHYLIDKPHSLPLWQSLFQPNTHLFRDYLAQSSMRWQTYPKSSQGRHVYRPDLGSRGISVPLCHFLLMGPFYSPRRRIPAMPLVEGADLPPPQRAPRFLSPSACFGWPWANPPISITLVRINPAVTWMSKHLRVVHCGRGPRDFIVFILGHDTWAW